MRSKTNNMTESGWDKQLGDEGSLLLAECVPVDSINNNSTHASDDDISSTFSNGDRSFNRELDEELDLQLDEMMQENSREIDLEIQQHLDQQVDAQFDNYMHKYFAREQEKYESELAQRQVSAPAFPSVPKGNKSDEPSTMKKEQPIDLSAQIQKVIDQYKATDFLGRKTARDHKVIDHLGRDTGYWTKDSQSKLDG